MGDTTDPQGGAVARPPSSHAAAGLTVESIVEAATALAQEVGINGMSMRLLAERLGVRAPTLYHHVRNKDALLTLLVRHLFRDLPAPTVAGDDPMASVSTPAEWIEIQRTEMRAGRAFVGRYPGLARYLLGHPGGFVDDAGDSRHDSFQREIDVLVRLGMTQEEAGDLVVLLSRWGLAVQAADEEVTHRSADALERSWEVGLDLLLAGVGARLAAQLGEAGSSSP